MNKLILIKYDKLSNKFNFIKIILKNLKKTDTKW